MQKSCQVMHGSTSDRITDNIDDWIASLEKSLKDLQIWLDNNLMKSNLDKYHLVVSSFKKIKIQIGDFKVETSTCEKLLEVHFYNRLILVDSGKIMHKQNSFNTLTYYKEKSESMFSLIHGLTIVHSHWCVIRHTRTNNTKLGRLHERFFRITL